MEDTLFFMFFLNRESDCESALKVLDVLDARTFPGERVTVYIYSVLVRVHFLMQS